MSSPSPSSRLANPPSNRLCKRATRAQHGNGAMIALLNESNHVITRTHLCRANVMSICKCNFVGWRRCAQVAMVHPARVDLNAGRAELDTQETQGASAPRLQDAERRSQEGCYRCQRPMQISRRIDDSSSHSLLARINVSILTRVQQPAYAAADEHPAARSISSPRHYPAAVLVYQAGRADGRRLPHHRHRCVTRVVRIELVREPV